jgi:hypothetical protein
MDTNAAYSAAVVFEYFILFFRDLGDADSIQIQLVFCRLLILSKDILEPCKRPLKANE